MRSRIIAVVLSLGSLAAMLVAAEAAPVATLTVGPSDKKASWSGGPLTNAFVGTLEGVECPSAGQDPMNLVCEHVTINVDVPASYWKSHYGGIRVTLTDTLGLQLFVYDVAGRIVGEAGGSDTQLSSYIPNASGPYELRVNPEEAILQTYEGAVTFTGTKGKDPGFARSAPSSYHGKIVTSQPASMPVNKVANYTGEPLAFAATTVGRRAAEPTIGIDKHKGVIFPAGAFDALPSASPKNLAHTILYASTDGGKTFHPNQPPLVPGTETDGEPTTLDPYVYVDKDTGRWFDVDLKGIGTSIDFSDDQGKTWTRGFATNPGANDHQTLTSGVIPAGSNLVTTDAAFPKILYYCTNQVYSALCARSLDGGLTFVTSGQAFLPVDPDADFPFCGSLHGHVVTDHAGRVFVPRGGCSRPTLAISEDAGQTWKNVLINGALGAMDTQTSVSVDAADNLYYVWHDSEHQMPYLSISRDHGTTWSAPRLIAPPGVKEVSWPTIVAGDAGRIAVMFPGTTAADTTDMSRPWNTYIVMSIDALGKDPLFVSTVANPGGAGDPVHRGFCQDRCGNMYDFLDIETAPDATGTVWAAIVDTCTTENRCNTVRATGATSIILGPQDGVSSDMQGVALRQISGPRLHGAQPKARKK